MNINMTSLPGLLIEHLISGSVCLLWIFMSFPGKFPPDKITAYGLFLIPIAYILGMFIDALAFVLTYHTKKVVRKLSEANYKKTSTNPFEPVKSTKVKGLIERKYKDISQEINMRSSRDRIARGMIINSIGILFFVPGTHLQVEIKVTLLILSVFVWMFFEYISHSYFLRAYDGLYEECK